MNTIEKAAWLSQPGRRSSPRESRISSALLADLHHAGRQLAEARRVGFAELTPDAVIAEQSWKFVTANRIELETCFPFLRVRGAVGPSLLTHRLWEELARGFECGVRDSTYFSVRG